MRADGVTTRRGRGLIVLVVAGAVTFMLGVMLMGVGVMLRVGTKRPFASLTELGVILFISGIVFGAIVLSLYAAGKTVTTRRPAARDAMTPPDGLAPGARLGGSVTGSGYRPYPGDEGYRRPRDASRRDEADWIPHDQATPRDQAVPRAPYDPDSRRDYMPPRDRPFPRGAGPSRDREPSGEPRDPGWGQDRAWQRDGDAVLDGRVVRNTGPREAGPDSRTRYPQPPRPGSTDPYPPPRRRPEYGDPYGYDPRYGPSAVGPERWDAQQDHPRQGRPEQRRRGPEQWHPDQRRDHPDQWHSGQRRPEPVDPTGAYTSEPRDDIPPPVTPYAPGPPMAQTRRAPSDRQPPPEPPSVFVYRDPATSAPAPQHPQQQRPRAATADEPSRPRGPFEPLVRAGEPAPNPEPPQDIEAQPSAPADDEGSSVRALDQIKDLYATAEAIGDENVDRHFDELLQRQRELISEYFNQVRAAKPESGDAAPTSVSPE